jgi:hypothetical protein
MKTEFNAPMAWSLLNNPVAADVTTVGTGANAMYAISGLPTIKAVDYNGYERFAAVTEVAQVVTIYPSATMIASTRYKFAFGGASKRDYEYTGSMKPVAYTTPATLIGNASDKLNMLMDMARKVNRDQRGYVTAGVRVGYLLTGNVATATITAGDTLVGGTSGATGVALNTIASGATGTLNIDITSLSPGKVFIAGETVTSSSTGTCVLAAFSATNPLTSTTLGLRLTDTGGYYNAKETKGGATEVRLESGFTSTDRVLTTAAVYQQGKGSHLVNMVPVMERTSGNLASGSHAMAINEAPVAANSYWTYVIKVKRTVDANQSMVNAGGTIAEYTYILYANAAGGSIAAFEAAMAALT